MGRLLPHCPECKAVIEQPKVELYEQREQGEEHVFLVCCPYCGCVLGASVVEEEFS